MTTSANDKLEAMLWGTFIGDALTLGSHWIYDQSRIERIFGRISSYVDVPADSYHKGKCKGDFTHYGDQALVLMESQKPGAFDLHAFADQWNALWPGYSGYVDGATKGTRRNFSEGASPEKAGSNSSDFAGASRFPVVVSLLAGKPLEEVVSAARAQTAMTHTDPQVVDSAEYFARVLRRVLAGEAVRDALVAGTGRDYPALPVTDWFNRASTAIEKGTGTTAALADLGLTCRVDEAFMASVYVLLKHADSFETALVENTMAGGDSAARGLIIGAILGAALGMSAIPSGWIKGMTAHDRIATWLRRSAAIAREHPESE